MRRIRWYAQGLAVAGLAAAVLSACGSSSSHSTSRTGTASIKWVSTTPAGSGSLQEVTWDLPYGEPTTLDYLQAAADSENTVLANLCEGLLRVDPNGSIAPSLAVSYSHPSPTVWIYHLRPGVRFSNGQPLTPADVIYSMKRNMNPKLASFWAPWFANVKTITADGAHTVKVTLTKPDSAFNEFLATAGGVVVEKAYAEKAGSSYGSAKGGVMCTGPYTLKRWTPGSQIVTVANPNYWDKSHQPKVKEIVFKFITNPTTIADALNSGEIDGAFEAPISATSELEKSSAGKLYVGKGTEFSSMLFTAKPGPIQNVRVREALSLLINREAIAKEIYHGTAKPINSMSFPSAWGYGRSVYQKAYDAMPNLTHQHLAEARKLLANVGKIRTLTVLLSADDVISQQIGLYLQSEAKQVGINLKLITLPAAEFINASFEPSEQKHYDVLINDSGYYDVPDPLEMALYMLTPDQSFNAFGYDNPTVTKEVTEARETLNPDKRAKLIAAAWTQGEGKDWVIAPLVNFGERLFMNKRVTGAPASMPSLLYYPWGASLAASK
jgi:peptide/nickel transport system substrate-binding protein